MWVVVLSAAVYIVYKVGMVPWEWFCQFAGGEGQRYG